MKYRPVKEKFIDWTRFVEHTQYVEGDLYIKVYADYYRNLRTGLKYSADKDRFTLVYKKNHLPEWL